MHICLHRTFTQYLSYKTYNSVMSDICCAGGCTYRPGRKQVYIISQRTKKSGQNGFLYCGILVRHIPETVHELHDEEEIRSWSVAPTLRNHVSLSKLRLWWIIQDCLQKIQKNYVLTMASQEEWAWRVWNWYRTNLCLSWG
jgi:hypothetical protein